MFEVRLSQNENLPRLTKPPKETLQRVLWESTPEVESRKENLQNRKTKKEENRKKMKKKTKIAKRKEKKNVSSFTPAGPGAVRGPLEKTRRRRRNEYKKIKKKINYVQLDTPAGI